VLITTVPISLRFLRGHVRFLKESGATVHLISSPAQALDTSAAEMGVAASGVQMTRSISPVRDFFALCQLFYLLYRLKPDIVHAHTPNAADGRNQIVVAVFGDQM